jgi:large subunit ribosomal protein L4
MDIALTTPAGAKSKKVVTVTDDTFGCQFNETLVHQVVTAYLAAGRSGTHAQKTRSQVRGGGRKPWKQKGSGQARAGSIRSPLWRGGGKVFAAVTGNYAQKVNRKMYRAALRSVLSELVRQGRLWVTEGLSVAQPKTKELLSALGGIGITGNALIIACSPDRNLALAARNIPSIEVVDVAQVDPVRLVGYEHVVATVDAVKKLEEALS